MAGRLTDRQRQRRLEQLRRRLERTAVGLAPFVAGDRARPGSEWRAILRLLDVLEADAATGRPRPPLLGPVVRGGRPLGEYELTHATSNLPGFPAFDTAFGRPGAVLVAPEPARVLGHGSTIRRDGRRNGRSVTLEGDSGILYWYGHVEDPAPIGARLRRGQRVAVVSANHEEPHAHIGVNAHALIGRVLEHHTNYTRGATPIGVQLERALR